MFITRKLGKLLHGKTSTFSILAATTLGTAAGMLPMSATSVGLLLLLGAFILMLNTNLFLAGVAAGLGKLLSLPLLTANFAVGRLLIDGPLQPIFRRAVNMPGVAWLGLDVYVVPGALVLGATSGLALGMAVVILLRGMRVRMASLESGSDRYTTFASKRWVRLARWVFFGKRGKKSYTELAENHRRWGNPVRPLGVVAVGLFGLLIALTVFLTSDRLVTAMAIAGLEKANGATVDIKDAQLDLTQGRIRIEGLAVTNPDALDRNLISAATLEGDFSATDLLRRRFTIDLIEVTQAETGAPRERPGQRVGPSTTSSADAPDATDATDPTNPTAPSPDAPHDLEGLLTQAKTWKSRLDRLKSWTDWLSGSPDTDSDSDSDHPAASPADHDAWIQKRIAAVGIAHVRADHLIENTPTLLIRRMVINGLVVNGQPNALYNVEAQNLSTHPNRVPQGVPTLHVVSQSGDFNLNVGLPVTGHQAGDVNLHMTGLTVDELTQNLNADLANFARGGTLDLTLAGGFSPDQLNLPLTLTLHDTTVALPGATPRAIKKLPLSLAVAGSLNRPAFSLDREQLTQALVAAGANELADQARSRATDALKDATDKLSPELNDVLGDTLGDTVGDTLGNTLDEVTEGGLPDWLKRR